MTRYLMAGVAVFAMTAGVAAAQSVPVQITPVPPQNSAPGNLTPAQNNDILHNDPSNTTSQAATQTVTRSIARPDGTVETTTDTAAKPVNTDGDFHAVTTIRRKKANGMVTEENREFTAGADGTSSALTFDATTSAGTKVKKKSDKKTDLTGKSRTDSTTTVRAPE